MTNTGMTTRLLTFIFVGATLYTTSAFAQAGQQPMAPPIQPGQGANATKEGPAEQGDPIAAELPAARVLPTLGARYELLELNGYLRFRTDWFKRLNLGFDDDPALGGAPFPEPNGCNAGSSAPCSDKIGTANMRLSLEPTINLTENTKIHIEMDVLDNLVLGSTPFGTSFDGNNPASTPVSVFSNSQVPPLSGYNSTRDSIVVRRAWADVNLPLGRLRFGRMPSHWGMGVLTHAGENDPVHGTMDIDNDFGDNVDRLEFAFTLPTTKTQFSVALDWPGSGIAADQTDAYNGRFAGQPWDLDNSADITQWTFTIGQFDAPALFDKKVRDEELALNWGLFLQYRKQGWDYTGNNAGGVGNPPVASDLVRRDAKLYMPDAWVRLAKDDFTFEAELAMVLGSIGELSDAGINTEINVRQVGGVARASYKFLEDDLKTSLELGFATGDQWDNPVEGTTHISQARPFPGLGDTTMNAFTFNRAYNVDMILFRELIGSVRNATYIKPKATYKISNFALDFQSIISFANKPISTPGNKAFLGVELDFDVAYETDSFIAGMAYGVYFPGGAMDHPENDSAQGGPGFGYLTNTGGAKIAHTIQTRVGLKF